MSRPIRKKKRLHVVGFLLAATVEIMITWPTKMDTINRETAGIVGYPVRIFVAGCVTMVFVGVAPRKKTIIVCIQLKSSF